MTLSSGSKNTHSPLALGSLALSMLLSSMGTSIPNIALPNLAQVYSASFSEVQWVILAYLLAVMTSIVGVGRLGDVIGRRRVLMAGIALFTFSALICGFSPALGFTIAARAIQGLGAAALMALTLALVSDAVPKEKLGRAMGLLGSVSALGTATGPTVGGLLIAWAGWRSVFLVMALLGALAFFSVRRYLPNTDPAEVRSLNLRHLGLRGTFLLGISLASYALTVTVGGGHMSSVNLGLLAVTAISGVLFAWSESQGRYPLIQWNVLRGSDLPANIIMNALVSSVMMATLVVGPFYLSSGLGLSAGAVGMVMSVGPITSALTGAIAGRIVDRLGAPFVMLIGLVELSLGALAMSLLPAALGATGYIAAAILLSPGYQMFQAANNTSVMSKASSEQRGVISALLSLSRNLGLITGTSVMGTIFSLSIGAAQITTASIEAISHGMKLTFTVAASLALVALIIAMGLAIPKAVGRWRREIVARVLLIGIGATLFMDAWIFVLSRFGVKSLNFAYLGRWIGHLLRGQWFHVNIAASAPIQGELWIGWLAHYSVGVAFAALLIASFGLKWAREPSLFPALIMGVVTVIAPWFVLQPALGLGIASSKTAAPVFAALKSLLTHTVYGFGLYLAARGSLQLYFLKRTDRRTEPPR